MYERFGKRIFDILFSLFLLIILAPLSLIISLILFFLNGYPIFFFQDRVGKNGSVFKIFKFKTMKKNIKFSSNVTLKNDSRIIKGTTIIRKYKLDELPQLLNVILGDMSIVGPRPTVHSDFEKMNSHQRQRVNVRPGLTGLAQISGNTNLLWPDRIKFDLIYIKNINFKNDLKIIFLTIIKIINKSINSNPPKTGEW